MGCQQVPAPGERGSGGIVTGIEERQTFSPQLLAAHPGAIFVSCLEQDREDIIALIMVWLALSDHLSHFVIEDALRVFEFSVARGGPGDGAEGFMRYVAFIKVVGVLYQQAVYQVG